MDGKAPWSISNLHISIFENSAPQKRCLTILKHVYKNITYIIINIITSSHIVNTILLINMVYYFIITTTTTTSILLYI